MNDAERYAQIKRTIRSHRDAYAAQTERAPVGSQGSGMSSAMGIALDGILTEIEILDSLS